MNIESFKTIVLINLVAISLFLSYSLWTSQPVSSSFQNQKYIQDVPVIAKKEISNVIFPSRMIVHRDNMHIASEQSSYINTIYKALEQGEFQDFKDISYTVPKSEFLSFVHGGNKTELIFPTEIPFDTMKNIFSIKDKYLSTYSFDRIVIDFYQSRNDEIVTYFVSYDTRKIYRLILTGYTVKQLEDLSEQFVAKVKKNYFMYKLDETRAVFLPQEETTLPSMMYVTSELQEEMFKNSLFTDPRYVKKDETEYEETYTDGTRLLRINKTVQMLNYENSSVMNNEHVTGGMLVQRSVDFINSHGGWTDAYRFYYLNSKKGETVFRLYTENNYPVFNVKEMSALKQTWGVEELSTYRRPLFKLLLNQGDEETVKLRSGRDIVNLLEKLPQDELKTIKSIDVGYEMIPFMGTSGNQVNLVKLKPVWVITYLSAVNGDFYRKIEWDDVTGGGNLSGLEQN
jgi:regulatory protein YycH of two-component signal transduction system YycFG